jgi:hypothetical protein
MSCGKALHRWRHRIENMISKYKNQVHPFPVFAICLASTTSFSTREFRTGIRSLRLTQYFVPNRTDICLPIRLRFRMIVCNILTFHNDRSL